MKKIGTGLLLLALILGACQPLVTPVTTTPSGIETETGSLAVDSVSPYGRFNGIDYHLIQGVFVGETVDGPFRAPFEVVTPVDPRRGNGRLVVEPFHFIGAAGARDDFIGPEMLFGNGFAHAGICWQPPPDFVEEHPCRPFEAADGSEVTIIAGFAKTLEAAQQLVGDVDALYTVGFSNSAEPLQWLLRDPAGQNLFDLSLVITTDWPFVDEPFAVLPEDFPESVLPPADAGRVMVIQSEADVILFHGAVHRDDSTNPNYRSYEVAGAQHVQGSEFPLGQGFVPVMRALFHAGDRWVMDDTEPPASVMLETAPADEIDPVYGRPTGVARDENLNAKGGVRLPDVTLGRGQYIATDLTDLVETIWFGMVRDLACEPLADGSPRFANHVVYVARFVEETVKLVEAGFLLPHEAYLAIEAAWMSDVGQTDTCQ